MKHLQVNRGFLLIVRAWILATLIFSQFAGIVHPAFADGKGPGTGANGSPSPNNEGGDGDCIPGGGWTWTDGPLEPEIALQAQEELEQNGIKAKVEAMSYGEMDSCGTFVSRGTDFTIKLIGQDKVKDTERKALTDKIHPVLTKHAKSQLGNVKLFTATGEYVPVSTETSLATTTTLTDGTIPPDAVTKKVYVIVFDPILSNGQKLSAYYHWNDNTLLTQQAVDFFKQASGNRINYTVASTAQATSWPEKADGFTYTESEYLAVVNRQQTAHSPDLVNYNKIVNSTEFDICGKLNRGEIDEVWLYGGPWFGFYESTLVGPGAYYYNSSPVSGAHTCNKMLPIIGMNYERAVDCIIENFGHRTESTMTKVYGSWQQNQITHNWDKFGLVKALSPNYSYSGCGSVHYPPNGTAAYDFGNPATVLSNCNDFANYPNLSDPLFVSQSTTCSLWGCNQVGYFQYWFSHLPVNTGCGPDNVSNSWWNYFANPALALNPFNACQTGISLISGSVGVSGVNISYLDGSLKTAITDTYGNYFFFVPSGWSGSVTPAKAGFTFSPATLNYNDIQADQTNQNYTANINPYTISGSLSAKGSGATVSYTGGSTIADSRGNYSFTVPSGWTGSITPSKAGYTFSPITLNITTPVTTNLINKNFSIKQSR